MYSITVQNSTGEYVLHNTYDEDFKLNSPVLQLELNKSGTLTFGINPDHPSRAQILPMASEIYVYDDNEVFWIGRPLSIEGDFDMMATVTCEGILGYLLDTQVPPFNFTEGNSIKGTDCVRQFLQRLVTMHNSRVGNTGWNSKKRFTLGTVTVMDSNDNLARSSEDYKSTLETINEKLIETHGGFLRLRISGSTRYIDYIETFGAATQAITFGENLLDLSTHVRAESIYTCVIPEGAQIEGTDTRLTLAGYSPTDAVRSKISQYTHGGAIFWNAQAGYFPGYYAIRDAAGEAAHGRIFIRQTWDDVTKQENLALKAAQYIGTVSVLGTTIELSAVDLSRISVDYKRFNLGEAAPVISIPHGINAEYQITQMDIDLFNPANSTMTLGGELGTFTFQTTKQTAALETTFSEQITDAVQNATNLLSGGLGGYLFIKRDDNDHPYEILIMNAATETAATRCVRMNQNGIGFGNKSTGSTSWTYRNAWTIDGNLIADFIKAGTLSDTKGNTQFNLGTGQFTMKKGTINLGSGNFTVNDSGYMYSKSGNIGGYNITSTSLYKEVTAGSKKVRVGINAPTQIQSGVLSVQVTSGGSTAGCFYLGANGGMSVEPLEDNGSYGHTYAGIYNNYIGLSYDDVAFTMEDNGAHIWNDTAEVAVLPTGLRFRPGRSLAVSGNLYIDGSGNVFRATGSSSSRKIKHDIKPVENEELDPDRLYEAEVIQYKYNDDFLSEDDPNRGKDLIGFIVEDLDEVYPAAVSKEDPEKSETWTWSPIRMIPGMLQLIQDQKKQIDDMESRITKLEEVISKLTEGEEKNG